MDISPTPELKAACRVVLGSDDPATVTRAMRGLGERWARTLAAHQAIVQLKALPHPTIAAMDAVFDTCCPNADFDTRCAIAAATAEIDRTEAEALSAEAAALRAHVHKRHPSNDA